MLANRCAKQPDQGRPIKDSKELKEGGENKMKQLGSHYYAALEISSGLKKHKKRETQFYYPAFTQAVCLCSASSPFPPRSNSPLSRPLGHIYGMKYGCLEGSVSPMLISKFTTT